MKLRNFQYKYLMRIVPNNKYLFKRKLSPTVLCEFFVQRKKKLMQCIFILGMLLCARVLVDYTNVLENNSLEIDLTYHRISFGILDKTKYNVND